MIERRMRRRVLMRWSALADEARFLPRGRLPGLQSSALQLRRQLERVLHVSSARLQTPAANEVTLRRPTGTDWIWRPALWLGALPGPGIAPLPQRADLVDGATLYHDCKDSQISARQIRNEGRDVDAPFGLRLDVLGFDGGFLSLVLDLPPEAAQGLQLRHLIALALDLRLERPIKVFARLNIKHGPNVEQILRELPPGNGPQLVEFDLAYSRINEKRVEKLWLDLIFETPQMNEIVLRDAVLSRRPRAEL